MYCSSPLPCGSYGHHEIQTLGMEEMIKHIFIHEKKNVSKRKRQKGVEVHLGAPVQLTLL